MRPVRLLAAAVVAVCLTASCTRSTPEVVPGAAPEVGNDAVQLLLQGGDLPPQELREPEPKTDRERFLVKAAEIYSFCDAWKIVEDIPEPVPGDIEAIAQFGTKYYDTLRYIDTSKKVIEKVQRSTAGPATSKRVDLSDEVMTDLKTLRYEVYGFLKRTVTTRFALQHKEISEEQAAVWLQAAVLKLSSDHVETVYQRLTDYAHGHCTF